MSPKDDQLSDFIKSIVIFAILTVVTVGSFGFYLFSNSRTWVTQEISRESLYRLGHVRDYMEATLEHYEEVFKDKVVSTAFQKYDGLGFLLNDTSGQLGYKFLELYQDIQNAKLSQAGMTNMTVYFLQSGFTVDSQYVYERVGNSRDAAFIDNLRSFPLNRWTIREDGSGARVLTYVRSLPYGALHEEAKGYLYLDVSLDYVTDLLGAMLGSADERFYALDADGTILLTNSEQAAAEFDIGDDAAGMATSVIVTKEAGRTTVQAYSPAGLSDYGWGFVVTRPLDTLLLESKKSQHNLIIAAILAALVGLVISLLMSRRVYVPLKNMMGRIQTLHRSLEKTRLLKLIHGDMEEAGALPYPYAEHSRMAVACIRFRFGALQPEQLASLWNGKPFRWEAVAISQEELAILFVLEPGSPAAATHPAAPIHPSYPTDPAHPAAPDAEQTVKAALQSLQAELLGVCEFSAGFGRPKLDLAHVSESFREAKQAARYDFLYSPAAVIGYREIEDRDSEAADMHFERFESGIHNQDMQAISSYLGWLESTLSESGCRIETAEWALMQLCVSLRRLALHYRLSDRMEIPDMSAVLKNGTLREGLARIAADSKQIVACLHSDATHAHADTIQVIQRYIHSHLHEDISLDRAAELVSFSPSYISKLFAEVLHMPFIEYLNRVRLEVAAELLQADNESVTRIAEQVGYSNVQYFCTRFKSKYEMTPNQYRKMARAKIQAEVM